MTPAEAASLLGVSLSATPAEVESAYRASARMTHPDRFAGSSPATIRDASARFVALVDARDILLTLRRVPQRRRSSWPMRVWTALLAPGLVLGLSGSALPWPWLLLVLPVVASAVLLAITGRAWRTTIALAAIYAGATAVLANFGALLALEALLPPVIAIVVLSRQRR